VNSYLITAPKDAVVLAECPQFVASEGTVLRAYRCKTQKELQATLADFELAFRTSDGLVVTFEDQATIEVFRILGTHTRAASFHNSLRYYIICETAPYTPVPHGNTARRTFIDQEAMEKFVMDYFTVDTTDYDVIITTTATPKEDSDYDTTQVIPFRITGACEYNLLMDLCRILEGEDYTLTFTCNK
jgi:hypothetical protein